MPLDHALVAVQAGFPAAVIREAQEGLGIFAQEVVDGLLVDRKASGLCRSGRLSGQYPGH